MNASFHRRDRPTPGGEASTPIVGVFVFEHTWRSWDDASAKKACADLASFGVNRFMTETWDLDQRFVDLVRAHGMEFWASVACYSDHGSANNRHPELTPILRTGLPRPQMEWYTGLIPTDRSYNTELASRCAHLATTFDFDGFCLDFMRWPLHWELELREGASPLDSSFDDVTMQAYRMAGSDLPNGIDAAASATWISENDLEGWVDFKCGVIESNARLLVDAIRSVAPTMPTGVFVVPGDDEGRRRWVGQDLSRLSHVFDEILPMAYHRILQREVSWLSETVTEARRLAAIGRVLPVVQVSAEAQFSGDSDWGSDLELGEHEAVIAVAMTASQSQGFVLFPGEAVLSGSAAQRIRRALRLSTEPDSIT